MEKMLSEDWKNHLIVTVSQRPRLSHSFSFNPNNQGFITTDAVSNFIFVTEFVAKNDIIATAATNCPSNSMIISYAYSVQKLPWKILDLLHRKVAGRLASIIIYHKKTVRRSL